MQENMNTSDGFSAQIKRASGKTEQIGDQGKVTTNDTLTGFLVLGLVAYIIYQFLKG